MRVGRVLATVFAVSVRGQGVFLGLVELARIVVAGSLQVVVSGSGVMCRGPVMVLDCGVRGRCCHRSILLRSGSSIECKKSRRG
jgi:hypothetical protein